MDNLIDFIKSSRGLLNKCLELCDSLEASTLSNDFTNEKKEEKLNAMIKKCRKLKSKIVEVKKIQIKAKAVSHTKKQNGDCLNENKITRKESSKFSKKSSIKEVENGDSELDVDELNNAAKEAILNSSDSESFMDSVDDKCLVTADKESKYLSDQTVKPVLNGGTLLKEGSEISNIKLVIKKNSDGFLVDHNASYDDVCMKDSKFENKLNGQCSKGELVATDDISEKENNSDIADADMSNDSINEEDELKKNPIKECFVLLEDLAKSDHKDLIYEDYIGNLEKDVNKLSQIPKYLNKTSAKNDDVKTMKKSNSKRNLPNKTSTQIQISSDEEGNGNDSESEKSGSNALDSDLENPEIIDTPLTSSESEDSSDQSKDDIKPLRKTVRGQDDGRRRVTRSLKIPIVSDSEMSEKTSLSNVKSLRNTKKGHKRPKSIVSLSNSSEEESDASASDLRKRNNNKRKNKGNKKQKIDDDDDDEVRRKKNDETRKKIHKIITESKVSEATKVAEQFEMERRKRMEEKQEMYNKSMLPKDYNAEDDKKELILEKNADGESIVAVHKYISDQLKVHQVEAVNFMYDCVIESVDCLLKTQKEDGDDSEKSSSAVGGCILAHCMGLGKTLSLIAFMHTMLTTPILNLYSCIVVCPANTALNWKKEWEMWMPTDRTVRIFDVCVREDAKYKMSIIESWRKKGGVLIIGYEMFRRMAGNDARAIKNKKMREKMAEALLDPGADFIVCDEGHLLKNERSTINKIINKVKTKRRIVLTGTPLQNKLPEYHTMASFVKPNLLGTRKEFLNRFVNPIYNGQHINSTPYDVKVMKKRSHILFKTLDGCVHRRDYSALVKYLPPKYEYVVKIRLTDIQMQLYRMYLTTKRTGRNSLFNDQKNLARIMTHPFVVCMHQEIVEKKAFMVESDGESFLDDESDDYDSDDRKAKRSKKPLEENNVIDLLSDDGEQQINGNDDTDAKTKKKGKADKEEGSESSADEVVKNWTTSTRSSRRNKLVDSEDETNINFELENLKDTVVPDKYWWSDIIKPEHEHQIEISSKLSIVFQVLRKANDIGDKVIIFSQSLLVLEIIEKYLAELHIQAQKVNEELPALNEATTSEPVLATSDHKAMDFLSEIGYNTWEKGLDYDRMDGSTNVITRSDIMTRFNVETDRRLRLFLISTKAGGMGVNLVAANRVIIFDVSWNPSHDIQAIFRSYRFGQNKPVYVYRLVSQGTIEEKMYERQVTKQSLSLRVVDEQQISRYFTEDDLKSLYKFEPDIYDPAKERETPILPKDRFLAEMIQELPQWIYGYHEHDSLLQNKDEEELTEAERQEAWKEFEDEKTHGPRYVPSAQLAPMPISLDPTQFAQAQMTMMLQQHPQYAALYGQNYMNLLRYVLGQQPELKYNPTQLSNRMQSIFFLSLQKYKDANPAAFGGVGVGGGVRAVADGGPGTGGQGTAADVVVVASPAMGSGAQDTTATQDTDTPAPPPPV